MRISIVVILSSLVLFGCVKSKEKHECPFLAPSVVFVNFTETDLDTVFLRKYANNNSFSSLIDTTIISKAKIQRTPVGEDSIAVNFPSEDFYTNFSDANWDLVVPGTTSQTRLSNIKVQYNFDERDGSTCKSFVTSLLANNGVLTYSTWIGNGYRIYITKTP